MDLTADSHPPEPLGAHNDQYSVVQTLPTFST